MGDADDLYQSGRTNFYGELSDSDFFSRADLNPFGEKAEHMRRGLAPRTLSESFAKRKARLEEHAKIGRQLETLNTILSGQQAVRIDDCVIEGNRPLEIAVESGALDFVNAVIAAGSDVNQCDASGKTALFKTKNEKIIEALLLAGADPTQKTARA
nr:hypothetical protein [uncultured bacterium]